MTEKVGERHNTVNKRRLTVCGVRQAHSLQRVGFFSADDDERHATVTKRMNRRRGTQMIDRKFHPVIAVGAWAGAVLMLAFIPPSNARLMAKAAESKEKLATFTASIAPSDPFSELNQPNPPKDKKLEFRRGETFVLTIAGSVRQGWHTYPLTRRAPEQSVEQLSKVTVDGGTAFQPIYPVRESEPEWKDDRKDSRALEDVYLEHAYPFYWAQEIYVRPDAPAGKTVELPIRIRAQVCDKSCVWETHDLKVPVTIAAGPPVEPSEGLKKRLAVKQAAPEEVPFPRQFATGSKSVSAQSGGASSGRSAPRGDGETKAEGGLVASVVQAVIGGFVALLTPCVFPMIPITVSFFLKQAERRKPAPALALSGGGGTGIVASIPAPAEEEQAGYPAVVLAGVYSGTIVLILAAGGLLLLGVLQQVIAHYITNFILSGVFLLFALSLLGMYDLTLPSWLQDRTSAGESRGGVVGVFFMALTFSIVSFACVGPIYGGFITLGASDQSLAGRYWKAVPPVLGFSVAFASPFFLLALFPSMLKSMPRAGSWMNSVKVVIGFLELAAAIKFLRTGELVLTKTSSFLTFDVCLGMYVALAFACGLYLLGVYRLPHDHESPESISVPRLGFSLVFLTLGLYMLPGLFKGADGDSQRPRGTIYAWVESFLLPETESRKFSPGDSRSGASRQLVWHHKLSEALAEAKRDNKLVFVDITGIACTNCRLNERDAFPLPEVQKALAQHVLLKLYAEAGVPKRVDQQPGSDETIQLRETVFKTNALPVYALLKPKDDSEYGFTVHREIMGGGNGLITDIPAFVKALSRD
jgi:thiol:disulfide interchange protein DsbD